MTAVRLEALNRSPQEAFVAALDGTFEASPWVAERAWAARPFASVADLHRALVEAVRDAGREAQLTLIRAHPDLATRARLSTASATEQAGAGLDRLSASQLARFSSLNESYRQRFGFPFVIAVKRQTVESILAAYERRLQHGEAEEIERALEEIAAISRFRLEDLVAEDSVVPEPLAPVAGDRLAGSRPGRPVATSYGKSQVTFYRTYAAPLAGLTAVPESSFSGRENILFAVDVDVEVIGDNFLPAYTAGDNRNVVPTDTMKNVIQRLALAFPGATLEGFLAFLGRNLFETYDQMHTLRLSGREAPFAPAPVPGPAGFGPSQVLFARSRDDFATAELDVARGPEGLTVVGHRCGRQGLQLIKVTGSAFTRFARDGDTTLAERVDRPLFIYLDVFWRYADVAGVTSECDTGESAAGYVAAEQVRDVCQVTFHEFVSQSIQHLVHEMGQRLLARFPQLAEVSFEAQNRLWDTAAESESDPRVKVYCDPRPPYGRITLTLTRN